MPDAEAMVLNGVKGNGSSVPAQVRRVVVCAGTG